MLLVMEVKTCKELYRSCKEQYCIGTWNVRSMNQGKLVTAARKWKEIKRCLLLGRKAMKKPRQWIKKQRHHFADKGLYCQSYGFFSNHLRMWECGHKKGWVLKNWCFQTVVLEKAARRSNQSILKEINPEYSLEGLMLKLKLQYFGLLMQRADSLEKILMLGKIEGRRRRRWQRMRWLDGNTDSTAVSLSKLLETVQAT